jgi:hypothetical protein
MFGNILWKFGVVESAIRKIEVEVFVVLRLWKPYLSQTQFRRFDGASISVA